MTYTTDIKDIYDIENLFNKDSEIFSMEYRLKHRVDNLLSEESVKDLRKSIIIKKIGLIQKHIDWVKSFAEHLRNNINDKYIPDLVIHYTERPLNETIKSFGFFRVHRRNCSALKRSIEDYANDYKSRFVIAIKTGLSYPQCSNFYRDLIPNHADFADGCDECRPYLEINSIISSEKTAINELEAMLADMERKFNDLNNNR